ncbi:non-homologous end joining protein Ku [Roseateles terrae]|uniref:Non-homologous end joining protein Ku n=1 Tax=Roseateles terrae TaxID=431060 RepID=A0ABR6GY65_9BURK|nr:Ku protein [Roseateles terrae]MBB3196681.1 DNA end-binding protein Ku [Roseateles terrae]OWQ84926.1 Ku protein [Roseateles terrae]
MATSARSIASLTLSFGLVNVPVRLYSATESGSDVRFHLLDKDGSRLKQQYVNERTRKVVERKDMMKGYEVEKDHFVLFAPEELKNLEEGSSHVIDIVSFVPLSSIDPLFYDKSYLLAPDKRGAKPYALLAEAMRQSDRCALAKWAFKAKQYIVQVRANEDGLILQQLRYAEEVRSLADLDIETANVSSTELQLALQLVDQIAADTFDPDQFQDEEKARVLAAIDEKVQGKQIVASAHGEDEPASGQVIDLMDALRSSLQKKKTNVTKLKPATASATAASPSATRKPAKRAVTAPEPAAAPAPRSRARK